MGDIVEDLRQAKHLSQRQHMAAVMFLRDLQAHHGQSAGLVSNVTEKIDAGRRPSLRPPGGPSIAALDSRLNRLHSHERELMAFLVKTRELARGTLADFGRSRSGYQTQRDARAYAVGRVAGLLDSLADAYLGPVREA